MAKNETPGAPIYIIMNCYGRYYGGDLNVEGRPVCDVRDRDNAIEMDEGDFLEDFPDGLPDGWVRLRK